MAKTFRIAGIGRAISESVGNQPVQLSSKAYFLRLHRSSKPLIGIIVGQYFNRLRSWQLDFIAMM